MQNFKEFLTRIQTFNLRHIEQEVNIKDSPNETELIKVYDITHETKYYDSFTYKSELRVLKDMALVDLLTLDKEQTDLQLVQMNKVKDQFKKLWNNYHEEYREFYNKYKPSYLFSIDLYDLFIVHNLVPDHFGVLINHQFVEDLGDSIKLRELFLKELIRDVEALFKVKEYYNQVSDLNLPSAEPIVITPEVEKPNTIGRYPTFTEGTAEQLFSILKSYFITEDHSKLENLLLNDQAPESPLIFRDSGNKLADAFKQLYDANMIVGCLQADLEKWIAPKFIYLLNQGEKREFTEGYLNSMISTKTRPCKSPILKIEQQDNKFMILPVPRHKK